MASGGGGGGESQPHLRVTAQSINNSVRRIHQDLHHTVARTMDDLFDRSPRVSPAVASPLTPASSPLAAHLGLTSPPGLGQSPPPGLQSSGLSPRPDLAPGPRPPISLERGDQPQHVARQHHRHCPAPAKHTAPVTQPCTGHRAFTRTSTTTTRRPCRVPSVQRGTGE